MEHEDQQVEQIKKFLKEYGPWIAGGLIIGFAALFSWRTWQDNQAAQQVAATDNLQQVQEQFMAGTSGPAVIEQAEQVLSELEGTTQAGILRLHLARAMVQEADFAAAAQQLNRALTELSGTEMVGIVATRLARVELERGNPDAAEEALNKVTQDSYTAVVAEIQGDIHYARGERDAARDAYSRALASAAEGPTPNLQMKLDNLAGN